MGKVAGCFYLTPTVFSGGTGGRFHVLVLPCSGCDCALNCAIMLSHSALRPMQ